MRRGAPPLLYPLLVALVLVWGGAFVAIRILVDHASALTVTLLRFVLTGVALVAIMALLRRPIPRIAREDRARVAVMALTGVAAYHLALNFGEHFVSAGVASLIVASMPVMAALMSARLLGERIGAVKAAGIAVALVGVAVLVLGGSEAELRVNNLGGPLVVAIAPFSFALYTVVGKPLIPRYGALPLTTFVILLGTVVLLPVGALSTARDLSRLSGADWGWLAFLALGSTVFGYLVWFRALREMEASRLAVWVYLVPLAALGSAALILDEPLTPIAALGGVLVLGGVILAERVAPRMSRE